MKAKRIYVISIIVILTICIGVIGTKLRANYLTNNEKVQKKTVDLVMFMGQSNMAGRGTASEAHVVPKGYGYEFRAISDPTKLYDMAEPFGVNENNNKGIDEPGKKTGSLVSAFTIAYYNDVKVPIVGVSASKGGSSIKSWQPSSKYLNDSIDRFNKANTYLLNNGYTVRKKFMVWCQGESDGDNNMSETEYKTKLQKMLETMFASGIEECFVIRIGNHRDLPQKYSSIIKAQTDFCSSYEKAILVSTKFAEMASQGLMKDSFHYKQPAYNTIGTEAGKNTAFYILNNKKPVLDSKTALKSWKFDFGPESSAAKDYINVTADMEYTQERGYGFLGLGPNGYKEDSRSDGFMLQQGQEIKLQEVSKPNVVTVNDDAIGVTDLAMPIRFALKVTPNTYYKVKVTLTGADQSKDAKINLFSEKRHLLLTDKVIPAGTNLTYEFNVDVQNVFSKVTKTYEDNMLNIEICGDNAAISSAEIKQIEQGKTLWVLGDSTVCDQTSPLPYFNLQNYAGVGQALSKYLGPDIALSNHAESGLNDYSSKPHFDQFKERIKPGDIVYFEFGHNHKTDGPKGYYDGISYYYDYVHQKGASFIIVGPIDRHNSSQYKAETNTWSSTLKGFSEIGKKYVDEKIKAGATDIAFVDLNAPSLTWYSEICEALGKKANSTDYYFRGMQGEKVDGTHPNEAGVDNFAKMFFDSAKAIVKEDPKAPQAKVLSNLLEGLREENPYIVPKSITALGAAPNSAYPKKHIAQIKYDFPLVIKDVALDDNGKILSMSVAKQDSLSTYGRGIVEIYKENGELKGTAYANEQIDNTIDGTQTVTFSTDLTLGSNEKLKAYVMEFKDQPGYPLTKKRLSDFYSPN